MKRIGYIVILVILMSSFLPVFAADNSASTTKSDIKVLTLEDALKLVEKNNPELILLDKKINLLTKQYDEAVIRSKSLWYEENKKTTELDIVKAQRLDWKNKLLELNNMKYERQEKLKNLKLSIEKLFADITIKQTQAKRLNDELKVLDKKLEQTKLKIKLGLLKDSDIKQIEAQKLRLQSELKDLEKEITLDMMNLKRTVNISINASININTYAYSYKVLDDNELLKIDKVVADSYEIAKTKEEFALLKLEREIAYHFSDNAQAEVDQLEMDMENKQGQLDDLYLSLESAIRVDYLNLLSLHDSIEIVKIDKELAQLELKKAESQFAIGKLAEIDLLERKIELIKQDSLLAQAINDYMNASQALMNKLSTSSQPDKK